MPDWNSLPVRVGRDLAMRLLCCSKRTFPKIIDAHPVLRHRLPGETRFKYLTEEIRKLMTSRPTVCDPRGRK